MNMRAPDLSTCKKFAALLAVAMAHILVLATFPHIFSISYVKSFSEDKVLVITFLPPENRAMPSPNLIEKRPHAPSLLRASNSQRKKFQQTGPAGRPTRHISAPEENPHDRSAALEEEKARTTAPTEDSNNSGLHQDPTDLKADIGAVDRRWLPRDTGSLQSGAGRPNLRARAPQEVLEQTLSRAARGDCRTRYAHMGLLAIPFLVTDTATDTGCKW